MSTPTSSRLQSSTCERFFTTFCWSCRFSHTKWYKMDQNGTYMTSRCIIQTEIPEIAIHKGWESNTKLPTSKPLLGSLWHWRKHQCNSKCLKSKEFHSSTEHPSTHTRTLPEASGLQSHPPNLSWMHPSWLIVPLSWCPKTSTSLQLWSLCPLVLKQALKSKKSAKAKMQRNRSEQHVNHPCKFTYNPSRCVPFGRIYPELKQKKLKKASCCSSAWVRCTSASSSWACTWSPLTKPIDHAHATLQVRHTCISLSTASHHCRLKTSRTHAGGLPASIWVLVLQN